MEDAKTGRPVVCAGCGNSVDDYGLSRCPVCDKLLAEDYHPLDTIRSAYRMQRRSLIPETPRQHNLFEENKNHVSHTSWACVVYSLVPYLGMLFIPFAVVTGGVGYYISLKHPHLGGGRLAVISLSLSLLILLVQTLLWWLLYLVPQLGTPSN